MNLQIDKARMIIEVWMCKYRAIRARLENPCINYKESTSP